MTAQLLPSEGEDWHTSRTRGIGASEAAAVLGLSPWVTPLQLWERKTGRAGPQPDNPAMKRGRELEPKVLQKYTEQTKTMIAPNHHVYASSVHSFMLATPDAFIPGQKGGIEAKTGRPFTEPPVYYRCQVQQQMYVMDWEFVDLVLLVGEDVRIWRIPRDEALIERLIEAEGVFWECVLQDTPPTDPNDLILDKEIRESLVARSRLAEQIKIFETRMKAIDEQVKEALGDKEIGIDTDGTVLVTWKTSETTTLDTARLKAEEPELVQKYQKTAMRRTFLVKGV